MFKEVIAVCCENRTEHVNTLRGQSAELVLLKQVLHRVLSS
jgi:hypothetical protein